MENLHHELGRLSTQAREWKPQQQQQQPPHDQPQQQHPSAAAAAAVPYHHQQQSLSSSRPGDFSGGVTEGTRPLPYPKSTSYQSGSRLSATGTSSFTRKEAPWQPQHRQLQQQPHQRQIQPPQQHMMMSLTTSTTSDLSATAVKEFIPGQGWNPSTAALGNTPSSSPNDYSTIPVAAQQQQPPATPFLESGEASGLPHSTVPIASPTLPPLPPSVTGLHALSMPDELYRYHRSLALDSIRQMDPLDPRHKAIPHPYCDAYCLDSMTPTLTSSPSSSASSTTPPATTTTLRRSVHFGYPSSTFRVVHRPTGHVYCLRRLDSVRSVSPKIAAAVTERWNAASVMQPYAHAGVVAFRQLFVAQRAVFFVHDYIPGARTLLEYLAGSGPLAEPVLWSCLVQLVSAMSAIHNDDLAVRSLRLQHVLWTADPTTTAAPNAASAATTRYLRLRINCLGMMDALEFEGRKPVADLQREDVRDLGRLLLSLATGTEVTARTELDVLRRCEAYMAHHYSRDLTTLTMTLWGSSRPPTMEELSRAIAPQHFCNQIEAVQRQCDRFDRALAGEFESGRLFRLLLKLSLVNERPEMGPNRRWSQSGDCYVLTLFRDYVFHQADGAGWPIMDLGHIMTALNKLDAADPEKMVLSSRDGKTLMVVSYADVAHCLESAYRELCNASVSLSDLQY